MRSRGQNRPKLAIDNAKKYVDYECELMTCEIKQVIKENLEKSKGTLFGQCNYDGVKSAKSAKLQSFGLQFVKVNFDKNLVLCLGYAY